jgi:ferredoxin
MPVRAILDQTKCQGHARCAIIAPEVFDVDDLGKGFVLVDEVPVEHQEDAREASFSCPEGAITIVE